MLISDPEVVSWRNGREAKVSIKLLYLIANALFNFERFTEMDNLSITIF